MMAILRETTERILRRVFLWALLIFIVFGILILLTGCIQQVKTLPVQDHTDQIAQAKKFTEDTQKLINSRSVKRDPSNTMITDRLGSCIDQLQSATTSLSICDASVKSLTAKIDSSNDRTETDRSSINDLKAKLLVADGTKWKWTVRAAIISFIAGVVSVFAAKFALAMMKVASKA